MKQFIAATISLLIAKTPNFRGKVRLLRALAVFCKGTYIKSNYGVLMQADLNDNTNLWALLGWYDTVWNEIREIMRGEAFIDIGANAGLFSLVAGRQVGPDGIVLAFEPQKPLFVKLVNNALENKLNNIYCFNLALSDSTKMVGMNKIDPNHSGIATIKEASLSHDNVAWAVSPMPDLMLIKEMLAGRVTTIKIDVEGHELQVLKGISWLFETDNVRKLIIEIDAVNLMRFDSCVSEIYTLMEKHGFTPKYGDKSISHYDEVFIR